jgi:hypothetical protein
MALARAHEAAAHGLLARVHDIIEPTLMAMPAAPAEGAA